MSNNEPDRANCKKKQSFLFRNQDSTQNVFDNQLMALDKAKYDLARTCYYVMLAEGLTWWDILNVIQMEVLPSSKIYEALEEILVTCSDEEMPTKDNFLNSPETKPSCDNNCDCCSGWS
ncbi:MAG: hypothetical protein AAGA60_27025 [Cyanobacteria bacterium P01_E01_bin.42]